MENKNNVTINAFWHKLRQETVYVENAIPAIHENVTGLISVYDN